MTDHDISSDNEGREDPAFIASTEPCRICGSADATQTTRLYGSERPALLSSRSPFHRIPYSLITDLCPHCAKLLVPGVERCGIPQ